MPNNNIELRSEEVQEILEATPIWMIRWGNIVVLSLIVMLLFISWFVKYPDVIGASAIISTKLPPQKEYAKTNGKIASILVTDNQQVKSNTALAILENTANYKDVFLLKSIIDTITINSKSFEFPINQLPILFLGDIESDFALFENSYFQYQLNKQYQPFSNQANADRVSKSQSKLRLQTLLSQKETNKSELVYQKADLDRTKTLYDKGVVSKQDLELKELSYLQAKRNFASIDASISQARETISNINSTSKSTILNKTREDISLLKTVIQSFNQLKRAIKDWELRYVLQSNINGTVSFLNTWTINQTVSQGDLLFTIIPKENSDYIAQLKTPAQNSGKLKIGQRVNIKLENYPDTEFGILQANIESIALFPDKEALYLINASLPKTLVTSYKKEIPFKHEMLGVAEIITDDLRLIDRFFSQLKHVFKN